MVVVGRPSLALAPFVELFWHDGRYRNLRHRERILPTGAFTIVFDLENGSSIVTGVRSRCIEFDTNPVGTVVGILFGPGGARAFFRWSAEDLYNETVPLELLWGSGAIEMCRRLREATSPQTRFQVLGDALSRRMTSRTLLHPAVECGLHEFQRVPHMRRVLEVVGDSGLSRRRFSQLFREQVGITPKLYSRLHRFYWVLRRLSSGSDIDWADVALAGGYSDQSHLVHEFREFSGFSPTGFLKTERPSGAHIRVS